MQIPTKDFKKLTALFGIEYASKITYSEYLNFWNKTPKELRTVKQ